MKNTKGAWSAPQRATPQSKFASYEEACKTVKYDPYFDQKWDYDPSCKLKPWEKVVNDRAFRFAALEALVLS